jgi:hypothetical protein
MIRGADQIDQIWNSIDIAFVWVNFDTVIWALAWSTVISGFPAII